MSVRYRSEVRLHLLTLRVVGMPTDWLRPLAPNILRGLCSPSDPVLLQPSPALNRCNALGVSPSCVAPGLLAEDRRLGFGLRGVQAPIGPQSPPPTRCRFVLLGPLAPELGLTILGRVLMLAWRCYRARTTGMAPPPLSADPTFLRSKLYLALALQTYIY